MLIQAKLALLTMLRGTETELEDVPYNFLFWGNRAEWIFPEAFKCIYANIERRPDCATCGTGGGGDLDLTDEEARDEVRRLLTALPKADAASQDSAGSADPDVA